MGSVSASKKYFFTMPNSTIFLICDNKVSTFVKLLFVVNLTCPCDVLLFIYLFIPYLIVGDLNQVFTEHTNPFYFICANDLSSQIYDIKSNCRVAMDVTVQVSDTGIDHLHVDNQFV